MTSNKNIRTNWERRFIGDCRQQAPSDHINVIAEAEPYVIDKDQQELIEAINLAIYLQRPLLLEGEAGCGKTRLAMAIAYELGVPFYRWDIRSTSKAKEGLYEYDALLRLHDVQVKQAQGNVERDPALSIDYIRYGALGNAFRLADCPGVVLIDEIDKADLDFPNDLLTVLDRPWAFEIPEVTTAGREKQPLKIGPAIHPPIVIITSNRERKQLPLPFLRRCIYYYIQFPKSSGLKKIIAAHYPPTTDQKPDSKLVDAAVDKFIAIRNQAGLFKHPGTSEFLDWVAAMAKFGDLEELLPQLKILESTEIPFREVLFKVQKDWGIFSSVLKHN